MKLTAGMREALAAQQAGLRGLRERDAAATRRRDSRTHEGADMMASLHALLAAKLDYMQVRWLGVCWSLVLVSRPGSCTGVCYERPLPCLDPWRS